MIFVMKSLADSQGATSSPPKWLPSWMHKHFVAAAPDRLSVAGDYNESELWMLENHVRDMERGRSEFVIAPMGAAGGVGTYRLSGMKKGSPKL